MPFFLSLRQTSDGTIEAGPSSSTISAFREYITTWSSLDRTSTIRRVACVLAFVLHIPLNIISILRWGILFILLGMVLSGLNLACIAAALWKLDVMEGERRFYGWLLKRRQFDFVILGLLCIYGAADIMLILARMGSGLWAGLFGVVWPCLIVTDILCFIAGWVATWKGISLG